MFVASCIHNHTVSKIYIVVIDNRRSKVEVGNIWRQVHENNKENIKMCYRNMRRERYGKKQRRRILVAQETMEQVSGRRIQ